MVQLKKQKHLNIHVVVSSSLLLILLTAWVSLMALMPMTGTPVDQLRQLPDHWPFFQTIFAVALTIAPVMLYFMVSLHQLLEPSHSYNKAAGYTLGAFYIVMASISYGAQLTLVPLYLSQDSILMAEIWYLHNTDSLAYFINQSGYALWAISALFLFGGMVKAQGIKKWMGILFGISAVASLIAFGGLLASVQGLTVLSLISGGLTIPIAVLGIVLGIRNLKSGPDHDGEHKNELEDVTQTDKADEGVDSVEDNLSKRSARKRTLLVLLVAVMVIAGVLGGFVGVVSFMNPVPQNRETLKVYNPQASQMPVGTPVTITTFNLGYGGLDKGRDFFMDGGKESRSESLERTLENTNEMISFLKEAGGEILLLQEVDIKSSRSFNVNQLDMLRQHFPSFGSVHGWNYKALWVPVPILNPMGYADSGITTFSQYAMESAIRYQLPGKEPWPRQLFDLDRSMVETRLPVEDGNTLVLVNLHLSAYDKGGQVREQQIQFIRQYLIDQRAAGHYVIAGGDWNHLLAPAQLEDPEFMANWPDWLMPLPQDFLPEGYAWGVDPGVFTVRDNATPYYPGESFVTVIDGFLVSNNVRIHRVTGHDLGFAHSDHNPVSLIFSLITQR